MSMTVTRIDSVVGSAHSNFMRGLFSIEMTGDYVTGGDTIDFTQTTANVEGTSQPCQGIDMMGGDVGGYVFQFILGSALNNNLAKIYSAEGTQLAAGAYPSALLDKTFTVEALFTKY